MSCWRDLAAACHAVGTHYQLYFEQSKSLADRLVCRTPSLHAFFGQSEIVRRGILTSLKILDRFHPDEVIFVFAN
jgi:hypothetical protein